MPLTRLRVGARTVRHRTDPRTGQWHGPSQGAFTLLETMLAMVILTVGVVAVVQAQREFLIQNLWSTHASTATYLATELRELSRSFPRHDRQTGGLYFTNPADPNTITGWGPEANENDTPDIDDLDDLHGAVFGPATSFPIGFTMTRRYSGPINAFGEVIPETLPDGSTATVQIDGQNVIVPLRGWTQIVEVTKVDPYNYSQALATNVQAISGSAVLRPVDRYPVRVTVTVLYQGSWDNDAPAVTSVSWIVEP
ncbi:MAG: prepilin-type N-terminal cleavage/methylation domain-containing protein [Phycisphaerales bacterium]